ncbi:MAG: serine hydrolase, partial [Gemmatimonadales bacterium]
MGRMLCTLFLLPAALSAQGKPAAPPPKFDAYVAKVMQQFNVPGMAIAIVKGGQVVLARGYGVKRLGSSEPVDAQTRFGIASNSKAFTALALGLLVEEGKLAWDAPVVRYLPAFQMYDPWVTREITVRDLLVHRSGLGLGEGDLLWWPPTTYERTEIVGRLRFMRPVTSFRTAYAYDNVLYLVAGELIEAVSGQRWESFVADRILRPVGMDSATVLHTSASDTLGNVASTHAMVEGTVRHVAPFLNANANPAAGINAGAHDMARWLVAQLDSGRVGTTRLWSQETARQLWAIVTPITPGSPQPELSAGRSSFGGYALGFGIRDYRGHKLVSHTGGLPGYVSRVAMLPDQKIGVAVLTNAESGAAFDAIAWHVLDHYLGAPAFDWLGGFTRATARHDSLNAAEVSRSAAARNADSRPSLPLQAYAGRYADAWYGDVTIESTGDGLVIRFEHSPALVGDLEHWQYDTFLVRWRDRELRADAFLTFALNAEGAVDRISMKPASTEVDFSFDFQDLDLRPAGAAS